ncbi:MAG: hypothetical protein WCG47_04925, partial [Dermatophilaceae bacterium]
VSAAWGAISSVGSGILDGLKSALNGVIGAINSVIGGINSAIDAANSLPGPDIPNIPSIPRVAKGGIAMPTRGGTLALIAEAGRPERIEPLDAEGFSKRDRKILKVIQGEGRGGGPVSVRVFIGDTELRGLVTQEVVRGNDNLARALATGRRA